MRRIGYDFKNKAGETVTPAVFYHPCWKPGCDSQAPHGRRVALLRGRAGIWSCTEHLNELETRLRDIEPSTTERGSDESSNGDRDLFGD